MRIVAVKLPKCLCRILRVFKGKKKDKTTKNKKAVSNFRYCFLIY